MSFFYVWGIFHCMSWGGKVPSSIVRALFLNPDSWSWGETLWRGQCHLVSSGGGVVLESMVEQWQCPMPLMVAVPH